VELTELPFAAVDLEPIEIALVAESAGWAGDMQLVRPRAFEMFMYPQ
jgi:hypothetical protein